MMKHVRKNLSLLLCLSLLSALLLVCSGCGNKEKDALIGEWKCSIDMTDMLKEELEAGLGSDQELMSYFDIGTFNIDLTLSFQKDDTYSMSVDEALLEQNIDQLIDSMGQGITKYFEDMIAEEGLDMTVDEVLEASGYTMDQLMAEAFNKEELMSSMDDMESSGTFKAKGGTLILTDDDGPGTESYELDGDKLTLTGEGAEDDVKDLYPLVFTRK